MNPADKIKMALLAAKLAHEVLQLITIDNAHVAQLQFRVIVSDLKNLNDHLDSIS